MSATISSVALQLETQSLNSIVMGFSFASAIAWFELVKSIVSNVVQVNKSGTTYYLLSAIFTTLLSILVFMAVKAFVKNVEVKEPGQPMYALTMGRA
jgi:hypothetical protein